MYLYTRIILLYVYSYVQYSYALVKNLNKLDNAIGKLCFAETL